MQIQTSKQPTLQTLLQAVQEYRSSPSQQPKQSALEDYIKKLQPMLDRLLNKEDVETEADGSGKGVQGQGKVKGDQLVKEELERGLFMQLVQVLVKGVLQQDRIGFLEALIGIVRIRVSYNNNWDKQESIYELAKQAEQNAVIALPYNPVPAPTTTVTSSDGVAQSQSSQIKHYYKQDQQLVSIYFQKPFTVVKREGISRFATKVTQQLCSTLITPFLQQHPQSYSLQSHIKLLQLLNQISASIYTYSLISIFKQALQALSQCLVLSNSNTSMNNNSHNNSSTSISTSYTIDKINKIIYNLIDISSRWQGSVYYSRKWEWDLKSKFVLALIGSKVSQTKLTAVKLLAEFCRKIQYSSHKPDQLVKFIRENGILEQVFSVDSHPEVVVKGKQIYQFLSKEDAVEDKEIDILLQLLDKSHQNVNKTIYFIIQSLGQRPLQRHQKKLLKKISSLPRASFFIEQTLHLLQTLMVIAPVSDIETNLRYILSIIGKFYNKLRKNLKGKLVRLYFQMVIMGVEEGKVGDCGWVVQGVLVGLGTALAGVMFDTFNTVVKNQAGKKIYQQCKQMLKQSIQCLFEKHKIHKSVGSTALLKTVLDQYQGNQLPLTYQQLCQLIDQDITFCKFIQFYDAKRQSEVIKAMLRYGKEKGQGRDGCQYWAIIVQVYGLIHKEAKEEVFAVISKEFEDTNDFAEKLKLGEFVTSHCPQMLDISYIQNNNHTPLTLLVLLSLSLAACDKKGYGPHLPYSHTLQSRFDTQSPPQANQRVIIKFFKQKYLVTADFQIQQYNVQGYGYWKLAEAIHRAVSHFELNLDNVKFLVGGKGISIKDLGRRVVQFLKEKQECLMIQVVDTKKNQWFQQSQLVYNGMLKKQAIQALTQVFTAHCINKKLHRPQAAKIFSIVSYQGQQISPHDSRIEQMFSQYSQNGQYITLQQWLNMYQNVVKDSPQVVAMNLRRLGYSGLFNGMEETVRSLIGLNDGPMLNIVRNWVVNDGQAIYNKIFGFQAKAGDENKINSFLKDLLYRLPIYPKYQILQPQKPQLMTQQNMDKQTKQKQEKDCSNNKPNMPKLNHQAVIEAFLSIEKANNTEINLREVWYIVGLYKVVVAQGGQVDREQQAKTFLYLLERTTRMQHNVSECQLEVLATTVGIIKQLLYKLHTSEGYGNRLPKSLVQFECRQLDTNKQNDKIEKSQQQVQYEYIQDPIPTSQPQNTPPSPLYPTLRKILPYLTIQDLAKKLIKLTKSLPQNYDQKPKEGQKRDFGWIYDVVDQLLLLYLWGVVDYGCSQTQVVPSLEFVFSDLAQIRSMFNNFYFCLCENLPKIKQIYYQINISLQKGLVNKNQLGNKTILQDQRRYNQFFKALNKMLRLQTSQNQFQIYERVCKNIQNSIQQYILNNYKTTQTIQQKSSIVPSTSSLNSSLSLSPQILLHNLLILDSLKVYNPSLQVHNPELWLSKLLTSSLSNQVRPILYRIAQKLATVDFNLEVMRGLLQGVVVGRGSYSRGVGKKMGLFNLGCICYINAALQQLFMIQPLRKAIIQTPPIPASTPHQQYFPQFQQLIYQLSFGKRQFFIPQNFCMNYLDSQNKPIDIKQQHDSDQFLNSLFDRLEKNFNMRPINKGNNTDTEELLGMIEVNDKRNGNVIRGNFCGQMANVITCQSCYSSKMKIQDFYILTLEIKNHKNLTQCFEKLTEPEVITDYYCDKCQRKVQIIQKQLKINKLPKYLFIHLQRLVFDLQSLTKIKLQHLIDYPYQLDLTQFMLPQALDTKQSPVYRLKGFVVHVGTSEGGHYYSLVRAGSDLETNQGGNSQRTWIKFDDSRVEECQWGSEGIGHRERQGTYMIIYEMAEEDEKNEIKHLEKPAAIGNPQLYTKVQTDNIQLIKQTILLHYSFPKYLLDTLSHIELPLQLLASSPNQLQVPFHPEYHSYKDKLTDRQKHQIQVAHDIILEYLRVVMMGREAGVGVGGKNAGKDMDADRDKKKHTGKDDRGDKEGFNDADVKNCTSYLIMLLHIMPQLLQHSLTRLLQHPSPKPSQTYLRQILISPSKTIRQAYKLIFIKILSIMTHLIDQSPIEFSYLLPAQPGTYLYTVQKVLQCLLGMLYEVGKNSGKMEEYMEVLALVMGMSDGVVQWFESNGLGPKLIHYISGDNSTLKQQLPSLPTHPKSSIPTSCLSIVSQILYTLLNHTINSPKSLKTLLDPSSLAHCAYFNLKFYMRLLDQKCEYGYVNRILKMLGDLDSGFLWDLCGLVREKFNRVGHRDQNILAYVHFLRCLLVCQPQPKDPEIQSLKLQSLLGVPKLFIEPNETINSNSRYYKYWTNQFTNDDEYILPVLQLLYTNRNQLNYFTLGTITALLEVMCLELQPEQQANSKERVLVKGGVFEYVSRLPSPMPGQYRYYTDWINVVLKSGLRKEKDQVQEKEKEDLCIDGIKMKGIMNRIAHLLDKVEQKLADNSQNPSIITSNAQNQKSQMLQQVSNTFNLTKYFTFEGEVKQIKKINRYMKGQEIVQINENLLQQKQEDPKNQKKEYYYQCFISLLQIRKASQEQQIHQQEVQRKYCLQFSLKLSLMIKKYLLKFRHGNYNYSFVVKQGAHVQVTIPYEGQLNIDLQNMENFDDFYTIKILQIGSNKPQPETHVQPSVSNPDIQSQQQSQGLQPSVIPDSRGYSNNYQPVADNNQNQYKQNQIQNQNKIQIQCPFCTAICNSFANRCPTCGEEWGEIF